MQSYANTVYAVDMCLSVLPVTCRYCIKTGQLRITQTMPHNSPWTIVFWRQISRQNLNGATTTGVPNAGAVG